MLKIYLELKLTKEIVEFTGNKIHEYEDKYIVDLAGHKWSLEKETYKLVSVEVERWNK